MRFHKLKQIRTEEKNVQIHHIYNADPFPFPVLRWLRQPVIYSISSGVGQRHPNIRFFKSLAAVVVSDERSLNRLTGWGLENIHLVRPGIDTKHFSYTPLPLDSEIRLMVGSAPWLQSQFRTKGIDALLTAAKKNPHLRLIFLWRGVLADEIERRVRRINLQKQVEIINKKVDVNQVLARVHASITLVADPAIIRSYPHSLMESLAAGKPIVVSRSIPMSDYVKQTNCGKVVDQITPADIIGTVDNLLHEYDRLQQSALQVGQRDFSQQALIESFQKVYGIVLERNK